ncbi:MAG: bifunctional glutamate N-acetyltransferase/amino-acid acetyltransferase ArgJ [Lachnospiraceae bacterium]|nr:bifunctional glutamate N-acetyltransferase/amino-acid acetyltransferase ArgJ [Lachnospiraceae bacterium]
MTTLTKEVFEGYTYVEGGVCAAKGFSANGLNCGINPDKEKNDLGLIFSRVPCQAAAVYTQNKVKGAPILVTQENLKKSENIASAVIVNSKNANTCNPNGTELAEKVCRLTARELRIAPEEVIIASTGVIGEPLPLEPFERAMPELVRGLSEDGNDRAATAIMTTDTVKKEVAVRFKIGEKECFLGGMAKGSGMIHPNMATTLNFITTDVAIHAPLIQEALSEIVKITYNCLSVDGDTSTNDMVSVMANGEAGNEEIREIGAEYEIFRQALFIVMENLTKMLAADGEGASKFLECTCEGAVDLDMAVAVAKSVISSDLVKTAMFGEDANCGRIFCAIGYANADFTMDKVEVTLASETGSVLVYKDGAVVSHSEEEAAKILAEDKIYILVHLHQGKVSAKAWGCDLTYDYVKINGEYRS